MLGVEGGVGMSLDPCPCFWRDVRMFFLLSQTCRIITIKERFHLRHPVGSVHHLPVHPSLRQAAFLGQECRKKADSVPVVRELISDCLLVVCIALWVLFRSLTVNFLKVKDDLFLDILGRWEDLFVSGLLEW